MIANRMPKNGCDAKIVPGSLGTLAGAPIDIRRCCLQLLRSRNQQANLSMPDDHFDRAPDYYSLSFASTGDGSSPFPFTSKSSI